MNYTIKELAELVNVSEQSLYKLIKKNEELQTIIADNSEKTENSRLIKYNQPVADWLINHYKKRVMKAESVGGGQTESKNDENTETNPHDDRLLNKIKKLRKKIKRLEAENERLLTIIENEQKEKQALLGILAVEKQEKKILLPEHKKHWWNK